MAQTTPHLALLGRDGHAPTVELRPAVAHEDDLVRRLAELDDAPELEGDVLLALIAGEPAAALSLDDGRVVADPFLPTADAVALLRLWAAQLGADRMTSARGFWRRRRRASARRIVGHGIAQPGPGRGSLLSSVRTAGQHRLP